MFHSKDGWHWRRNENGSVSVEHHVYGTEKNELGELMYTIDVKENIDADSWASIVASVSASGEAGGRWFTAREFHDQ